MWCFVQLEHSVPGPVELSLQRVGVEPSRALFTALCPAAGGFHTNEAFFLFLGTNH